MKSFFGWIQNLFGFGGHEWYDGPKRYKDASEEAINAAILILREEDGIRVKMKWDKWRFRFNEVKKWSYINHQGRPVVNRDGKSYLAWFDNNETVYIPRGAWFSSLVHEAIHYLCQVNKVSIEASRNHSLRAFKAVDRKWGGRKL